MALTEQIPLAKKLNELEERVAKLEKAHGVRWVTEKTVSSTFGEHWDKMWHEFHEVMKAAFD